MPPIGAGVRYRTETREANGDTQSSVHIYDVPDEDRPESGHIYEEFDDSKLQELTSCPTSLRSKTQSPKNMCEDNKYLSVVEKNAAAAATADQNHSGEDSQYYLRPMEIYLDVGN